MTREERDPYDARTTRSTHRGDTESNDRPAAGRPASPDPLNPDWRSARGTRPIRRGQGLPSSRQEFVLWMQYGGWKIVAGAVVVVLLVIAMISLSRTPRSITPTAQPTALAGSGVGTSGLPSLPSPTVGPLNPTAVPAPAGGARFRVINTGSEGLFLRPDHNTDQPPVKTLPDGALVTIVGQDFSGPDRVWKNVKDDEGSVGWVAADFLQAMP